ncbi:SIR2 family protein [Rhizobium sp. 18055]|uniref:SIR2 family protein n=1 Tax=Rhizobium sp. 18055 TaxID=2681403 RepID=UPI00135B5E01|nr:SIR2 family protein [Rhizobium sp. 18055]
MFNIDLVDDLARQKVVLFLGAGVSSSALTRAGQRMKGWHTFLRDACDGIESAVAVDINKMIDERDYLLACEMLQGIHADNWPRLIMAEYGQAAEPSQLHKALISLDQRIVLTTNFDKLLEAAWENKFGTSTHYPIVLTGIPDRAFSALKDYSRRYIIKIHGSTDDADNVVFSRSQYIKSAFANPIYTDFIDSLLLNYTFLFVGFSMDDPAIISLMEEYSFKYGKSRSHYIFVPEGKSEKVMEINKRLRKLVSITYYSGGDHAKLPALITELSTQMAKRRNEIYASMKVENSL